MKIVSGKQNYCLLKMKELIILRHSKSSWDYNVDDINRPLSESGIHKIEKIAEESKTIFKNTEIIFSSNANRALHTSIILIDKLKLSLNNLIISNNLYTFSFNDILKFILEIDDKVSRVVIVGHNPALTDIANYFSENKILNLPTSRWVKLIFNKDNWSTINNRDIQISLNNIKSEK